MSAITAIVRYGLISLAVVGLGCVVLLLVVGEAGREGVLLAAGVALPVQILAFGLLARAGGEVIPFFLWWAAGIALRVVVVALVGLLSTGLEEGARAALVLSLVGFFFVLLLLEPMFLKGQQNRLTKTV